MVAIGAGAGMAAVYSVPLGGALFALDVLRGTLSLRLALPALAASLIATKTASFVVADAPLYTIPAYEISPEVYLWTLVASPFASACGRSASSGRSRWADRVRPSDWRRLVAPPLVFLGVGLLTIVFFPSLLGNGQALAQLLFLHPLLAPLCAHAALAASAARNRSLSGPEGGAPGGLFRRPRSRRARSPMRGVWRALALEFIRG